MPPDPKTPRTRTGPNDNGTPPASRPATPPEITNPARKVDRTSSSSRQLVAGFLSLFLGVFLAAGVVSLLDDSLILLFGLHLVTLVNGLLTCLSGFLLLLIYVLMGITPVIPKRVFLPVILLNALALLALFPAMIYHHHSLLQLDWLLSLLHTALVLGIGYWLRDGGNFHWSIVGVRHLGTRLFGGRNLSVFLLLNIFVILPALLAYTALCASLAVQHFTDGFLALRPGGLIMQARKYVRDDGKTILLFPMSHIAEADFYQAVSQSASSNSVVLLEGVTDEQNLLTNGLSYERAAKSMGLAEQHDDLNIVQGELVRADVDVRDFSPSTIAILNMVGLIHAKGLNAGTVLPLMQYAPPPDVEQQLFADILRKRNEHLLKELRERLAAADHFVIPWGAVHMPEIAKEIQKSGFRLVETHEYVSIRFGPKRQPDGGTNQVQGSGKSK